jgi:hypothetical protein
MEHNKYMIRDRLEELSPGRRTNLSTQEIQQIATGLVTDEYIFCSTQVTPFIRLEVHLGRDRIPKVGVKLHACPPDSPQSMLTFSLPYLPFLDMHSGGNFEPEVTMEEIITAFGLNDETKWRLHGHGSGIYQ